MADYFGEIEFEQVEVVDGKPKVSTQDLTQFLPVIASLMEKPVGTVAKVNVLTGEIIQSGSNRGRGRSEAADARAFHAAAAELGTGLRLMPKQNADGTTTFRMYVKEKRVFSEEATQKRNLANQKRYLERAEIKAQQALAASKLEPDNEELKLLAKEATEKVALHRNKIAELSPQPAPKK